MSLPANIWSYLIKCYPGKKSARDPKKVTGVLRKRNCRGGSAAETPTAWAQIIDNSVFECPVGVSVIHFYLLSIILSALPLLRQFDKWNCSRKNIWKNPCNINVTSWKIPGGLLRVVRNLCQDFFCKTVVIKECCFQS